ncbi:LysR family transcriptional regulator [Massilia arenosa]|uniref:LysR family transcriptional regulator n=1 Tax=Zemynaea arenosa TaxID=2561931 RepID=A0A4Y9SMN4_9BURK|nr:LysR family transcriptional regulator [Massilia arenosa]TFW26007.1 LysR family transcriptional regulator [Massilia arenosa]
MTAPDLNLLLTLDVLLAEGSVVRAAERLHLSQSAMSRSLARLREATNDPLLVRAGRGLVPTPRALELREQVGAIVAAAQAALRPADKLDLPTLERTFTLRTTDGFVENFGPALLARVRKDAPHVRLRFVHKADKDSAPLRDGRVDLDTGVVSGTASPEIRTRALFTDRFVGVVRADHPLADGRVTAKRYAAASHVVVSRRGQATSAIDDALDQLKLKRDIATIVGGFAAALSLARSTDLVATVPERHTGNLRTGLHTFPLPVDVPEITVSMLWHPRMDGDLAHRWLRTCVLDVCGDGAAPGVRARRPKPAAAPPSPSRRRTR